MGTELDPHASVSMYQAHELCEGTEGLELEMARKVFDRAHESDDVALLEQVDRILSHGVNLVAVENVRGSERMIKGRRGVVDGIPFSRPALLNPLSVRFLTDPEKTLWRLKFAMVRRLGIDPLTVASLDFSGGSRVLE